MVHPANFGLPVGLYVVKLGMSTRDRQTDIHSCLSNLVNRQTNQQTNLSNSCE